MATSDSAALAVARSQIAEAIVLMHAALEGADNAAGTMTGNAYARGVCDGVLQALVALEDWPAYRRAMDSGGEVEVRRISRRPEDPSW